MPEIMPNQGELYWAEQTRCSLRGPWQGLHIPFKNTDMHGIN